MEGVSVCGGTLGEALNTLRKIFFKSNMWLDELTELLSKCTIKKMRLRDVVFFLVKELKL
ncbi:hypothetical protein ACQKLM_03105 [Bacillus thuringiensis]|uniref:hypothetical protein n=1 Tax=Bacillus thuringiensis TaxID=1428 RepID=UPI003D07CAB6